MSAEILFENFDLLGDAPNGVAKLRELIFELSASGQLLGSKKGSPVEADLRYLPEVSEFIMGQAPAGVDCNETGEGTIFVKAGEFGSPYPEVRAWTTNPLRFAKRGDVLICVVGATVGKLNLAIDCAIGRSVAAIRPNKELLTTFLYYSLMPFVLKLRRSSRGSAYGVVGKDDLGKVRIWVPGLDEQRSVVAKVDQLMALCDELEEKQKKRNEARINLNTSALDHLLAAKDPKEFDTHWQRISTNFDLLYDKPETVGKLRQAILQLAVQGKLVPQDPKDEPASVLLEKIKAEKERLIKEKKIKRSEPLPPIGEDEVPYKLPKGWVWARVSDIASHRLGKMLDAAKNKGDMYPYLRNVNVQWMRFNLDDVKEMRFEKEEITEYELKAGDLLVCEGGKPGRCAIWSGEPKLMFFQKAIHRVRPFGGIEPWFLLYNLYADAQSGRLATQFTGATIRHFTGQELAQYVFGLPPLNEQRRIMKRLKDFFNVVDELETKLTHAEKASEELVESVVREVVGV